ncbi:lytic transglycosylase domain-containing protein [Streptomyces sp. NBC_00989]|uniref:lytic transglycosylase domain-containing protein n=1 Tax=Streptomyces sp. NBC_00989 TaxID=2903705 RepID=UPI00386888BD|nr:lytic transglycosylase domain-containing protein [Streptomyces sp. NBC_00989]
MSDSRAPRRRWWLPAVVFALALYVIVRAANTPQGDTPPPASASTSAPTRSADSASASASAASSSYDPADYVSQVRTRAQQAHISAQLAMAILYNEAYKPHAPSFERAWQKYKPDASFGIANMHRATFDEVKKGRDFADRRWDELPDDRDLAIEAEAWFLHDLAAQLPTTWSASYTRNELLALGYSTGAGNMLAFARGATPGGQAQSYLDKLHANWAKAGRAVGTG